VPAVGRFAEHRGRHVEGLDVVFEVGALAADVEAQPFDDETASEGLLHEVHGLSGSQPNLEDSSTIEPVFGTRSRRMSPAWGACFSILSSSAALS